MFITPVVPFRRYCGCQLTREMNHLKSRVARLELKRLDGNSYSLWNMRLNASIRAKPYQYLIAHALLVSAEEDIQVVHRWCMAVFN